MEPPERSWHGRQGERKKKGTRGSSEGKGVGQKEVLVSMSRVQKWDEVQGADFALKQEAKKRRGGTAMTSSKPMTSICRKLIFTRDIPLCTSRLSCALDRRYKLRCASLWGLGLPAKCRRNFLPQPVLIRRLINHIQERIQFPFAAEHTVQRFKINLPPLAMDGVGPFTMLLPESEIFAQGHLCRAIFGLVHKCGKRGKELPDLVNARNQLGEFTAFAHVLFSGLDIQLYYHINDVLAGYWELNLRRRVPERLSDGLFPPRKHLDVVWQCWSVGIAFPNQLPCGTNTPLLEIFDKLRGGSLGPRNSLSCPAPLQPNPPLLTVFFPEFGQSAIGIVSLHDMPPTTGSNIEKSLNLFQEAELMAKGLQRKCPDWASVSAILYVEFCRSMLYRKEGV